MKFSEITNSGFRTLPAQSYLIRFTFKEILSHIMPVVSFSGHSVDAAVLLAYARTVTTWHMDSML